MTSSSFDQSLSKENPSDVLTSDAFHQSVTSTDQSMKSITSGNLQTSLSGEKRPTLATVSHQKTTISGAPRKSFARVRHRCTREQLSSWIKEHPEDSIEDIAQQFQTTSVTITHYLNKYKIDHRRAHQFRYDKEALAAYVRDHPQATRREIGVAFNKSYEEIVTALRYYNISVIKDGRKQKHPHVGFNPLNASPKDFPQILTQWIKDHPEDSIEDIARHFKKSRTTITYYINKHKIAHRRDHAFRYDLSQFQDYLRDHPEATYAELGRVFNKNPQVIALFLKKNHVVLHKKKATEEPFSYDEKTLRNYLFTHPEASHADVLSDLGGTKFKLKKALQRYGLFTATNRGHALKEQKEALIKYLESHPGTTMKQMSAFFKVNFLTVKNALKACDISFPRAPSLKSRVMGYLRRHPKATYAQMSKALGKPPESIERIMRVHHLPYKGHRPQKVTREALTVYVHAHPEATYDDLAHHFNCRKTYMRACLKRYALPLPPTKSYLHYPEDKIKDYMHHHPDASYKELLSVFGGKQTGINRVLKKLGIPYPKNARYKYDRDLMETYLLGRSMVDYEELARVFNGTKSGVYVALVRYGLIDYNPKPSIRFPQDAVEKWVADHPQGTYAQLAKSFKTNPAYISKILKKYGLPPLKVSRIKLPQKELTEYIAQHPLSTAQDIAQAFKCKVNSAKTALKRYGLSYVRPYRNPPRSYKREELEDYLNKNPLSTYPDLMAAFKAPRNSLRRALTIHKLPRPKSFVYKYEETELTRYLKDHPDATLESVAQAFKGSPNGVYRALKRYGLKLNPKRKHPS